MELIKPINKTILDKINKNEGVTFLTIQESSYQKEFITNEILSKFPNKEVIKVRSDELNFKKIESLSVNLYEISILCPIKIFILEDINEIKTEIQKKLLELLSVIPEYVIVILTAKTINKTNPIYKQYAKNNLIIDNTVTQIDIEKWITTELKRINLKDYPANLPSLIIQSGENNIDAISEILNYLEIYIKEDKITLQEYEKLFPSKNTISDFKILDSIYSANYLEYMTFLKQILKNKNEFLIISIFIRTFAELLEIKSYVTNKLSPYEIATKCNMKDWLVKKNISVVSNYTTIELQNKLNFILKAEAKLKDKNLGVQSVFEDLFFKLAPIRLLKGKVI